MKEILFLSTTLGGGGAERIISYLINELINDDKKITLLLLKEEGNSYLKNIDKKTNLINLKLKGRIRYSVFRIIREIVKIRPDICYVGLDKLNIMLALFLPIIKPFGIRFIVRETNVLSMQYNAKNPFIRFSYKYLYNMYNSVIVQSFDMKKDLIDVWGIKQKKITLINNPIDIDTVVRKSNTGDCEEIINNNDKTFICVGRLNYQKGYDILIKRLALVKDMPFKLYILGTGELEYEIKNMISRYQLDGKIQLLGFKENPYVYINKCDAFILSSRFEGFPNVLLEANALGKPVFCNRCPGGINEIIKEGINGISCNFESEEEFLEGFRKFNETCFDNNAIIRLTRERYDKSVIMPKYKDVFNKVLMN